MKSVMCEEKMAQVWWLSNGKKLLCFCLQRNGSNFRWLRNNLSKSFQITHWCLCLRTCRTNGVASHALNSKNLTIKQLMKATETLGRAPDCLLAGYMKIVGPTLLAAYEGRIINIHPYLPEFPGLMVLRMLGMQVLTSLVWLFTEWILALIPVRSSNKSRTRSEGDTLDTFETRIQQTEYIRSVGWLGVARK